MSYHIIYIWDIPSYRFKDFLRFLSQVVGLIYPGDGFFFQAYTWVIILYPSVYVGYSRLSMIYPLIMTSISIEHDHRKSEFSVKNGDLDHSFL